METLPKAIEIPRNRRMLTAKLKKMVATMSGYRCSFPDCNQKLLLDQASFIGEIASIESIHPHGPRFSQDNEDDKLFDIQNYLLLCPNHHRVIDRQPEIYTAEWLRKVREEHLGRIQNVVSPSSATEIKLDEIVEISIEEAICVWQKNRENASEEFWQVLLQKCPAVLAQAFPQSMFQLGSKCYVGGKSYNNKGGNLVDFLYASRSTNNVVLIEIKTPKTKLLGKKYRDNVYSMSDELCGSLVQVLNYKDEITKKYHTIRGDEDVDSKPFSVFNPKCLVLIGSMELEFTNSTQLKSLELFRNNSSNVEIITYDELFQKAQDVLDMVK